MALFDAPDFAAHEQVRYFFDAESGLKAIIALHDTRLGPAVGGCRMWPYASDEAALTDVLRLSAGMTWKSAMAGLPLGGGKAVIIGDSRHQKSPALMRAFGRAVESFGGHYYTGEDVGMTPADMSRAGEVTRWVLGREGGQSSGDPSPVTAEGVLLAIEVAVRHKLGAGNLRGLRVAIQGLGHVGMALAERLHSRGVSLVVSDIDATRVDDAVTRLGAAAVAPAAILAHACDVLAPCALGAVINEATLPGLRCAIVAGSANNQLARPEHGDALHEKGILYAPDYVANAGGLINIAGEILASPGDDGWAASRLPVIPRRLEEVFVRSRQQGRPPHRIADAMAREIVEGRRLAA